MTGRCPTPHKLRFATVEAAARFAARRELGVGKLLTPYACDNGGCGWIHLTSAEPVPAGATADPALINELRHATPDAFRAVVETDAAGHLDMPHRIALRQPARPRHRQRTHRIRLGHPRHRLPPQPRRPPRRSPSTPATTHRRLTGTTPPGTTPAPA
jgi:hypothetical protein